MNRKVLWLLCAAAAARAQAPRDVNVVNTPSVSVSNTPSVTVSNTPAVTVSNSPTVTVGNSSAAPVPVHAVGTGTPVRLVGHIVSDAVSTPGTETTGSVVNFGPTGYVVPAGKQLIIEFASAFQTTNAGLAVQAAVRVNSGAFFVGIPCVKGTTTSTVGPYPIAPLSSSWSCVTPMKLFANAGEDVSGYAARDGSSPPSDLYYVTFVVGGTLVDAP
jgi:hypothetical protein